MKKIIFLLACLTMCNSFFCYSQLTNGLVGYWKLDEVSGSVLDASGSNAGNSIGAIANQSGKLSTAYTFDGINDYINIPNSTLLNIQGSTITLSAWVRPMENKVQMIVNKICAVGTHVSPYFQYNLQLFYDGSKLYPRMYLSINGTPYFVASQTNVLSLGKWWFITGTYDGSTMRLYINGAQVATTSVSGSIKPYSTPVYIGINGVLGEAFKGTVDEVGIWNRALSPSDILDLYNSGNGKTHPFNSTIPSAPSGLTALATSCSEVSLSWTDNSSNETGFKIERKTGAAGTYAEITTTTAASYSNTGLAANALYYYRVRSYNGAGNSAYTSEVNISTGTCSPTQNIILGNNWLSGDGGNEGIRINSNGIVGIGTNTDFRGLLTVNGKIFAKEIEVISTISSDYVFEPEYELLPLTELEIYLKKNKHLPGIPSALEFKDKGQNLAVMQDMLLRKIEELTLYIIELQKINEEQNKIIKTLTEKIGLR